MKKIIVTSQNRRTITGYAARCRNFSVFIVQPERKRIISREPYELFRHETYFETAAGQLHPLDDADVLITSGMGSGLQQELAGRGIEGLITTEQDPVAAVKMYLRNNLPVTEPADYYDTDEYIEDLNNLPPEIRRKCCGNTDSRGGCCGRGLKGLI
ncbi:NifB/NifX family molybdenum-iron cluster-binding protein [Spongorhabdus nitratireducens]